MNLLLSICMRRASLKSSSKACFSVMWWGCTAFYYTRRFDGKIGGKTGYRKFHPQYTCGMGGEAQLGLSKKFSKNFTPKKKKKNKTKQPLSYLSQSSMENNVWHSSSILSVGRPMLEEKVYSVVSHILIGHNMKQVQNEMLEMSPL